MKKYDIVFLEKEGDSGLEKQEITKLINNIKDAEIYPIEILSTIVESSAQGFITRDAANALDFDYVESGLKKFICEIMENMDNESPNGEYVYKNLKIFLSRNI